MTTFFKATPSLNQEDVQAVVFKPLRAVADNVNTLLKYNPQGLKAEAIKKARDVLENCENSAYLALQSTPEEITPYQDNVLTF